ncbi:MAG TPA: hypothetical protein VFG35_17355, partial [Actinoplanes sp.]|nr:hypothetical protein [Actinoplanes sp.]
MRETSRLRVLALAAGAVATMLGVAACGSTPANSPGSAGVGTPESASPHSGHGTAVAVPPPPL